MVANAIVSWLLVDIIQLIGFLDDNKYVCCFLIFVYAYRGPILLLLLFSLFDVFSQKLLIKTTCVPNT